MKSKILHILMTASLLWISLPGYSEPVPGSFTARYHKDPPRPKVDLNVERAYTAKRWIGLREKGIPVCPKVTGWKSETLEDQVLRRAAENLRTTRIPNYESPAPFLEAPSKPAVDRKLLKNLELDRYCIYTPLTVPAATFSRPDGLAKVERDRLAISTTSSGGRPTDDLSQRIWPVMAQHFRSQTGQVTSNESSALSLTGEPSVRLTFIDSQPDGVWPLVHPGENGSLHGFTLAHLANDLVCPASGSCAARIATRRALGYRAFNPQEQFPPDEPPADQSGHVGLVGDLATAIFAEVVYWRQFEPDKKLILNLSLGWDGEAFGDLNERCVHKLEPSVRSVYEALRFARRSGALVIAAAGNQRGDGDTEWPLLPAAWELRRPNWFRWSFFRKPVYAAGGVEWQGLPVANFREGARTRRVAYADHAVTTIGESGEPTAMLTGTSVSSAVTASIAAVVWHLRPELRPAQVMKLLAHSGNELGYRADFHVWKPLSWLVRAPQARRLSLCAAVAKACGPDGERCPAPECTPWKVEAPALQEALEGFQGQQYLTLEPTTPPAKLIDMGSQRWVIPQPEATPCPGCSVVSTEPPSRWKEDNPGKSWTGYKLPVEYGEEWIKEAYRDDLDLTAGTVVFDCGTNPSPPPQGVPTDMLLAVPPPGSVPNPLPISIAKGYIEFNAGQSLVGCSGKILWQGTKNVTENFSADNTLVIKP